MTTNLSRSWMECACDHPDHSVRVSLHKLGPLSTDVYLWLEPRLTPVDTSLWSRFKLAIKILFVGRSEYFVECILNEESIDNLSKLIVAYRLLRKLRTARERKSK